MIKLTRRILVMVLVGVATGHCLAGNVLNAQTFFQVSSPSNPEKHDKSTALKPAQKGSAASTHVTITVDQPFTQDMARRANLDPANPRLSSDGIRSDASQMLASSECLLAETLVAKANGFNAEDELDTFCKNAAGADSAQKVDAVKTSLEEHAGTRIDDALIHIVVWNKGKADGAWYQYDRHASGWSGKLVPFTKGDAVTPVDHLLGHGNVAFLAIHLGIDDSCDISYDISAQHTTPLNQQDVADLIKLATDYLTQGTTTKSTSGSTGTTDLLFKQISPRIGVWGGQTLLQLPTLPASITLTPKTGKTVSAKALADSSDSADVPFQVTSTCTSKPAGVSNKSGENTNAEAGSPASGAWRAKTVRWTPIWRASKLQAQHSNDSANPGPGKADSSAAKDPLANMDQSVTDEGIYWWDVSVAMPVSSYKNLKFDSQNNLIVVKQSNDIKPYGLFDFFPGGADLREKNGISMLGLFAGLPMSSQPLQKSFVGGGFTIGIQSFRFQPLVGVRIEKDTTTATLTPGSPGTGAQLSNDLRSQWHAKLQIMLSFSIGDARKVLGLK